MAKVGALFMASFLGCTSSVESERSPHSETILRLEPIHDTVGPPFTAVGSAVELTDGRVLALDVEDGRVFVVNFDQGRVEAVGRQGNGPSEYQMPLWLLPYRGDTSVLLDPTRLTAVQLISSGGLISAFTPGANGAPQRIHTFRNASDSSGHLYAQVSRLINRGGARSLDRDSALIERIVLSSGVRDTVATISMQRRLPAHRMVSTQQPSKDQPFFTVDLPFATLDEWGVLPDGSIVVASAAPFQLTIQSTDGKRVVGPVVPDDFVLVSPMHKDRWRMEKQRARPVLRFGQRGVSAERVKLPYQEPVEWPVALPAFLEGALKVAPDGTIWIERAAAAEAPTLVDIFSAQAVRIARVQLPLQRKLVAVSTSRLYLVRIDADGQQFLERWRRPPL